MTKPNASDAAIKLARANQLDIGSIKGTGSGDQVTKPDVEKYLKERAGSTASSGGDQGAKEPTDQTPKPGNTVSEAGAAAPASADNGPTVPAEAAAEADAAARAEATEDAEGKTLEIARVRDDLGTVWWCPFCDNSQPGEHRICGGCGAARQGDNEVAEVGERVKGP